MYIIMFCNSCITVEVIGKNDLYLMWQIERQSVILPSFLTKVGMAHGFSEVIKPAGCHGTNTCPKAMPCKARS
jgi:hypothetical protein